MAELLLSTGIKQMTARQSAPKMRTQRSQKGRINALEQGWLGAAYPPTRMPVLQGAETDTAVAFQGWI